ncbi:MAG: excinuclease ABC subunit A, partial [Desulfovibrio sp.]
ILSLPEKTKFMILAPIVEMQKGTQKDRLAKLKARGFSRVRADGEFYRIDEVPPLDKNRKHSLDLVVDRLVIREGLRQRLSESVELALKEADGRIVLYQPDRPEGEREHIYSTSSSCPHCHIAMPVPKPQLFSFNTPSGACPRCVGLGTVDYFEPRLIAPNRGLSLQEGALLPWHGKRAMEKYAPALRALGKRHGFSLSTPLKDFSSGAWLALFYGEDGENKPANTSAGLRRNWMGGSVAVYAKGDYQYEHFAESLKAQVNLEVTEDRWPGVIPLLEKGMQYGDAWRDELGRYMQTTACPSCHGQRLSREALAVRIDGLSIADFCALPIDRELEWLKSRTFEGRWAIIAQTLMKELLHRLSFLVDVGLGYLTLARCMTTLSGGEAQR